MKLISTDDGRAVVSLDHHELVLLSNALNETLEAVDPQELSTRVGGTEDELEALLDALGAARGSLG